MATRTARSVARLSSHSPISPPTACRLTLASARAGDHPSIHGLLVSIFHGPSAIEFQSQVDEPGYEPADRILVKDGDQIAAHLRLARQTIRVGSADLPAARFMDLATAPAYRSRGVATALLAAGERAALQRGTLVGLTRTKAPQLFARQGWSFCGRHVFSTASPRAVLAELAANDQVEIHQQSAAVLPRRQKPVQIRPLRRIELGAIVRLYDQHIAGRSGWPRRSEAYWEWLLARGACDRVYVAAHPLETTNFAELLDSVVGYACVRKERIIELVALPGRENIARQLAERIFADAREHDAWSLRYDAPPDDPLHNLFRSAGGRLTHSEGLSGEFFMAKILDPLAAIRRLTSVFAERAAAAGFSRLRELGIELRTQAGRQSGSIAGIVERFRVRLVRGEATIETGGPSRHSIVLGYSDLAPLLLGDLDGETMARAGRARFTSALARELAAALLPGGLWWRPPLDDLLAS